MKLVASIIFTVIAGGLFALRDDICKHLFPRMKFKSGEWDGSNMTTMNFFSLMVCFSFLTARTSVENRHLKCLWDIIIGLSISDVVDRLYFNRAEFTKEDWGLLIGTVAISILDAYTKYNSEWITKKVQSLWMKSLK